jgi:hypothetical protein
MAATTDGDAPRTRQARVAEATYTIQQRHEWDVQADDGEMLTVTVWEDLVTVTVPARTKRKTVLEKGLVDAGVLPPPAGVSLWFRALDAESARGVPVEAEAQLRIGGAS